MKRMIRAHTEEQGWPSPEFFLNFDGDEEEIWEQYFADAENEVYDELEILGEPSTQGGEGAMFVYDESNMGLINHTEPIVVDYKEWVEKELQLAAATNHERGFKDLFKDWMVELMEEAGWSLE